ncbi:helix-turn-helix domain-containing protein [Streptomyces sp. H39-C1]|uniref:helix-turn-helix domain-containing protein n=1 Tax=Streptomyces sp. H39-C1 TaxID=3004355 RepID=UPI0022B0077C|nr:helix-turn-helix domain-containing protein [Streptomyces sp. H39-C1]MCZ4098016.1 helix-turn-helix domain-containing protein [Streptomyces sp. H39-C1]
MSHDSPLVTENVAEGPDPFLTVAEVVARLRVSKSTVYNLIGSGRLPAHRMGRGKIRPRGYRVPESQVEQYLQNSRTSELIEGLAS